MTPQQRAIAIVNRCCPVGVDEAWRAGMIEDITDVIQTAVQEMREESEIRASLACHAHCGAAELSAYNDSISLIKTLVDKCCPNDSQELALMRAISVIKARIEEIQ